MKYLLLYPDGRVRWTKNPLSKRVTDMVKAGTVRQFLVYSHPCAGQREGPTILEQTFDPASEAFSTEHVEEWKNPAILN